MTRDSDRCAKPGCGRERRRHAERFVRPVGHAFVPPEPTPGDGEADEVACDFRGKAHVTVQDIADHWVYAWNIGVASAGRPAVERAVEEAYAAGVAAGRKAAFGEAEGIAHRLGDFDIRDAIVKAGAR